MSGFKFITFTDVHISDVNPALRIGNYRADILNKLTQVGLVGQKLGAAFYVLGGDLYHHKPPMRTSHELNRALIETFSKYGAPIYTTEGNHDLRFDSYQVFGEQPLSVMYASNTLIQARDITKEIDGIKVRIRSIPFEENPDLQTLKDADQTDADLSIRILHLYSSPKGGDLFGQKLYSYDEIAELGDDIFILGHYHVDQGIVQVLSPKEKLQTFVNVGAISRGTISEDDVARTPKIGLVSVDRDETGEIVVKAQAVSLRVKPAGDVFDIQEKEKEKEKVKAAEEFVIKLEKEIEASSIDTKRVDEEIDKTDLERPVVEKVKYYLAEADLQLKSM